MENSELIIAYLLSKCNSRYALQYSWVRHVNSLTCLTSHVSTLSVVEALFNGGSEDVPSPTSDPTGIPETRQELAGVPSSRPTHVEKGKTAWPSSIGYGNDLAATTGNGVCSKQMSRC